MENHGAQSYLIYVYKWSKIVDEISKLIQFIKWIHLFFKKPQNLDFKKQPRIISVDQSQKKLACFLYQVLSVKNRKIMRQLQENLPLTWVNFT